VVKELRDDLIGFGFQHRGGAKGRGAVGGGRRGLFDRTWQQARHAQDARVAGRRLGFLTPHVTHLLAPVLSQSHLEGRSGRGQWFRQMAQIVGRTAWMAKVRQDRGDGRHPSRLLVAEHSQNRPLPVLQRGEEGFARGLSLFAPPAAAQGQAARQFADEPNLGRTPLGRQAVEGHDQAPLRRGDLGQVVVVLPLVASQQRQGEVLIQRAHVGLRDADLGGQFSMNLAVGGAGLLPPPAHAHQHLIALAGARKGDALPLCGEQAQARARTGRVRTAPRSAGHREDAIESLHGLIPGQIRAHHQQIATVGTG
jgi:hypothetical protein